MRAGISYLFAAGLTILSQEALGNGMILMKPAVGFMLRRDRCTQ
jgi:hypothetical protein